MITGGARRSEVTPSSALARFRAPAAYAAAIALLARLLAGPLPLNYYDTAFALIWGREIDHGQLPNYHVPGAADPHPLATAVGVIVALLGTAGAWEAVQVIVFVALGVVGVALYSAASSAFGSRLAGILAALALVASPPFLSDAVGGSGLADLPATAFVLSAAALELRRPRRGTAPLVLLALAGLLRPEAWGVSLAYWCWLASGRPPRRELLRATLIVLSAPIIWAASDLVIAGNAAFSLSHAQASVDREFVSSGIADVPVVAFRGLRELLGVPVLVVGCVGALVALFERQRSGLILLALLALSLAEFIALGVLHLPLVARYLLDSSALIPGFFAYALTRGRIAALRRLHLNARWLRSASLIAAIAIAGYVGVVDVTGVGHVAVEQRAAVHAEDDLVSIAPQAKRLLRRCGVLYVPPYAMISLTAYDLDLSTSAVHRIASHIPRRGLVLAPRTGPVGRYFALGGARSRQVRRALTARGFRLLGYDRSWLLLGGGCAHG
jgi:hypothetical protein